MGLLAIAVVRRLTIVGVTKSRAIVRFRRFHRSVDRLRSDARSAIGRTTKTSRGEGRHRFANSHRGPKVQQFASPSLQRWVTAGGPSRPRSRQVNWGNGPGGRASIGPSALKVLKLTRPKPRPMAWAMQMVEPSALTRRVPDEGERYGKRKGQAHSANSHCGPKVQQFASPSQQGWLTARGPSRPKFRQVNWGNGPGGRSSIGPSAQKVLKLSWPKPRPMAWAMQMVEPSALTRRVPDEGERYGKRKGQAHSAAIHCGPKVQQFA